MQIVDFSNNVWPVAPRLLIWDRILQNTKYRGCRCVQTEKGAKERVIGNHDSILFIKLYFVNYAPFKTERNKWMQSWMLKSKNKSKNIWFTQNRSTGSHNPYIVKREKRVLHALKGPIFRRRGSYNIVYEHRLYILAYSFPVKHQHSK